MRIYSIGYEGRSPEAFCEALSTAGVRVVIDVRAVPWSQRPQFRKTAIQTSIADFGINYIHCKAAGNPYRPKKGETLDMKACAKAYAKHLREHPEIVEELANLVKVGDAALLCYEGHRDRCHRGVLLDALTKQLSRVKVIEL